MKALSRYRAAVGGIALAGAALAASGWAHHSTAMFAWGEEKAMKDATVERWVWTNPHTFIYVRDAQGNRWAFEGMSPNHLSREGWSKRSLAAGEKVDQLTDIRGTAWVLRDRARIAALEADSSRFTNDGKVLVLPSFEEVCASKPAFARMSGMFQRETNPGNARPLLQVHGQEAVYFNPPALPLDEAEMDALYDLPFQRAPHPGYEQVIPAFETVKHSLVTMRG